MDTELRDLYQEVIVEHSRQPRNFYAIENDCQKAEGHNPLCGDKITVYLRVANDRVEEVSFQGCGCAISQASASLMTEALLHKSLSEVEVLFQAFHKVMMTPVAETVDDSKLAKLKVLSGVREFPMRVKCATLAWHTLKNALEGKGSVSTTE